MKPVGYFVDSRVAEALIAHAGSTLELLDEQNACELLLILSHYLCHSDPGERFDGEFHANGCLPEGFPSLSDGMQALLLDLDEITRGSVVSIAICVTHRLNEFQ